MQSLKLPLMRLLRRFNWLKTREGRVDLVGWDPLKTPESKREKIGKKSGIKTGGKNETEESVNENGKRIANETGQSISKLKKL